MAKWGPSRAIMSQTKATACVWIICLLASASAQHALGGARKVLKSLTADGGTSKGCKSSTKGVALMTVAVLGDNPSAKRHFLYWLAVATKRLYAHEHNYPLYVVSHSIQQKRPPAWEKLLAARAVMEHSCAEWVWATDATAYVMNMDINIQDVIKDALKEGLSKNGVSPEILVTKDCNGMNTGSIVFHNSEWTRQHLADAWFTDGPSIPGITNAKDQAALTYYVKTQPDVAKYYHYVPQRLMNAYPEWTKCSDGSGTFVERDGESLVFHFVEGWMRWFNAEHADLSNALHPAKVASLKKNRNVGIYALHSHERAQSAEAQSATARLPPARNTSTVVVELTRSSAAGPWSENVSYASFKVDVALKPHSGANLGWPVAMPAFVRQSVHAFVTFAKLYHSRPAATQQEGQEAPGE